jgi:CelD/BcsL family acetyltransferase involved in cellulose biosynthesis
MTATPAVRVELAESFAALREEWSALPVRTIFGTWDWQSTWWEQFGAGKTLLLHAARGPDGRLDGVLPLYLARKGPVRVVRFLGHPQGDELGPVGRLAPPAAAAALTAALAAIPHDLFLGEQLPGDESWTSLLGARRWRLESSPVLKFSGSWDDFVKTRSANFRQQLARRERRLRATYEVELRLADDAATLDEDLDMLFALHRAHWSAGSGFGPESFHREVARRALEHGRLRLWFLSLDGKPAAAWFGFRVGGVETYYQAGRDPAHDSDSVGFVLLAHTIRAALDDGIQEYRFLRGPEPYKGRFANSDPGLETVALGRTVLGRGTIAGALGMKRSRDALKSR